MIPLALKPDFHRLLSRLAAFFGPQHWWPAKTPFEVCVGAILTQNTAWSNVTRAIANLKRVRHLNPRSLHQMDHGTLATHLRPSGYFNIKSRRLKSFVRFFRNRFAGSMARMKGQPLESLRQDLLGIHGVGRETADSILLYALEKPIFVVDAYTRRIFSRHDWILGNEDYDEIRAMVENQWKKSPSKTRDWNELHALIVATGKKFCRRKNPVCSDCPLKPLLPRR